MLTLLLFVQCKVLKECQELWKAIIIDEFQDTSAMQYSLLQTLASHKCITVVGDDDQVHFAFWQKEVGSFVWWLSLRLIFSCSLFSVSMELIFLDLIHFAKILRTIKRSDFFYIAIFIITLCFFSFCSFIGPYSLY